MSGEQTQAFLVSGATTSHSPEDDCPLPGYSWDTLTGGFAISYKMQPHQCGRAGASLPANRSEKPKDSSAQVSALDGLVPLFGGTSGLGGMFLPGSQL